MEIQWLGHACFRITHKGYSVIIDPYNSDYTPGYPKLKVKADKVLVSHEHYGHNYRQGVELSGKPESACPFEIEEMELSHDGLSGRMRGFTKAHILEADGMKIVHMGDIGAFLNGGEISRIFGADVMMIGAGSCTALPAQDAWRTAEETASKVIIPMHYRDGSRGNRRLERIEDFIDYCQSVELVTRYNTDTITITPDTEPQIAVLKYMGK
jgi:L-ascorbate metabolism protein UlaG (beta-lactamase superfamily)